jgi:hypothetical protein
MFEIIAILFPIINSVIMSQLSAEDTSNITTTVVDI